MLRADAALTLTLAGEMQEAEAAFRAAETGGVDRLIFDGNIRSLLAWRVDRLQTAGPLLSAAPAVAPEWRERLEQFRRRFGVPLWPDRR